MYSGHAAHGLNTNFNSPFHPKRSRARVCVPFPRPLPSLKRVFAHNSKGDGERFPLFVPLRGPFLAVRFVGQVEAELVFGRANLDVPEQWRTTQQYTHTQ